MANYKDLYGQWLSSPALTQAERAELQAISQDEKEIEERFYAPLSFGTAGLRGIMGMGLHRMNVHVIRHATQSFADVIVSEGEEAMARGVVLCYDCRHNSDVFAREAGCIMAANGIRVRIFEALRPTPELSFAIRHYGATAGINITASHNPKEYNGYKVYWSDGAQLPPRHAEEIARRMRESDLFTAPRRMDFDAAVAEGLITFLGEETDQAYLSQVMGQAIEPEVVAQVADELRIVYTPFHGCGYKLVPQALGQLGVKHLYPVPEQMVLDGSFPTVVSPNPENPEGFYLAVELAKKVDSDLIIGTDPDSDRVGVLVRRGEEYIPITGNQMGELLLDYIISARQRTGTMPEKPAAITTIVSTAMIRRICQVNHIHFDETFTGFKFMAEKLAEYAREDSYHYLLAFEESYGYMMGDYVRDKDGVTASMMIAEMAAWWHTQGKTLLDAIDTLYEKYGYFQEETLNLVIPGMDGARRMQEIMTSLRTDPPKQVGGLEVVRWRDYLPGCIYAPDGSILGSTPDSNSNVLYYELTDGSNLVVRPSGTEPKLKMYTLARDDTRQGCAEKKARITDFARSLGDRA